MMDGQVALVDEVEEPTDVCRVERRALLPCAPCRCSGCGTVSLGVRPEPRLCLWCRGSGFRMVRMITGPRAAELGGVP
jgi:hypothetical protein